MSSNIKPNSYTQKLANNYDLNTLYAAAERITPITSLAPVNAKKTNIKQSKKKLKLNKKTDKPNTDVQDGNSAAKTGPALGDSQSSDNAQTATNEGVARASQADKRLPSEDSNSLNPASPNPSRVLPEQAKDTPTPPTTPTPTTPAHNSTSDNSLVIELNDVDSATITDKPNTPIAAAPEPTNDGPYGIGWGIWAGAGAATVGVLALAGGAGGGGANPSAASAPTPPIAFTSLTPATPVTPVTFVGTAVTIQNIALGPLITTDPGKPIQLTATVYAADGKTIIGSGPVDAQGQASFTLDHAYIRYSGAAIVKISGTASYLDVATNQHKTFDSATSAPLLAVHILKAGQAITVHVNPLTTFAAIEAGVQPDGTVKVPLDKATVKAACTQVASLIGLTGDNAGELLTQITPEFAVDNQGVNGADLSAASDAVKVGTFLAVMSGLEKSQSTDAKPVTTKEVIQQWNDRFNSTRTDMDGIAIAPLLLEGAAQVSALGNSVNRYVFDKFKVIAVGMQSDKPQLKIGDTAHITFTFSVDPGTTFDAADIVLDGGTLGTLSGSGTTRTATFTPTANVDKGTASITVKTNSGTVDASTVTNIQTGSSPSIRFDTKAPTLAITSNQSALKMGETATITFTFGEDPGNSFGWDGSMGDVSVTRGTLGSLSGTGTTRTATFTPAADTDSSPASITVAAGSYFDAAGNSGTAGTTPLLTVDTVAPQAPTLALGSGVTGSASRAETTAASGVVSVIAESGSSVRVTFTDSAATPHRVIKTVTGTNAALGVTLASTDLGNGNNQLQDGSISVTATATDAVGNTSTVGNALTISLDTLAPNAPTLALGTGVSGGATAAEATAASGVVRLIADNGSIVLVTFTDSATPTPRSIIKTITGTGAALGVTLASTDISGAARLIDGNINVTATITDAAGNPGTASTSFTLDTVAPTAVNRQTGLNLAPNTQQYAKLPTAAATVSGDLTLEAWVYVRAAQTHWVSILDLASATGSLSDNVELGLIGGCLAFQATNGSTNLGGARAITPISTNAWHHLAATVVGTTVTLYVDGVSVVVYAAGNPEARTGTLSAAPVTATRSSSLVGRSNVEANDFNGYIRDVRIYDDARSGPEIASDKGGSTPGTGTVNTNDSNLVGYYPFISDATSGKSGGTAATLVGNPKFPIPTLSFSADTEVAGDFVTRTAMQTISAKLGAALLAGETLQYRLDSGNNWTDVNAASINGTSVTLSGITLPVGSHNLEFQVKDAAGNLGLLVLQPYTLDNKAYVPTAAGLKLVKASGQFATLPASAANVSGDLTLEAWVFADGEQTANAWASIFDLGVGENDSNLVLAMTNGQFGYSFRNGSTTVGQHTSDSIFANNTWHHVALVVGGDNNRSVTLYVNGESVDSGSLTAAIAPAVRSSALVGKSNSPSGDPSERFNGTIRDVRIYDADRTQAEIRSDMAGIVDIYDANASLKGYFPFSKNEYSLNGFGSATLTASPVFTNPALSFSNDTGTLGDFKTSTTAQTITAKLSGSLAAGEKVFGTVNGDAATPTWVDLSSFTSNGTVTWTGVTLGATGEHLNGLQLQVRDSADTNIGTLFTQSYTVL